MLFCRYWNSEFLIFFPYRICNLGYELQCFYNATGWKLVKVMGRFDRISRHLSLLKIAKCKFLPSWDRKSIFISQMPLYSDIFNGYISMFRRPADLEITSADTSIWPLATLWGDSWEPSWNETDNWNVQRRTLVSGREVNHLGAKLSTKTSIFTEIPAKG